MRLQSTVVAAETEDDARAIHPGGDDPEPGSWVAPELVQVRLLGEAAEGIAAGEVLCSDYFNS